MNKVLPRKWRKMIHICTPQLVFRTSPLDFSFVEINLKLFVIRPNNAIVFDRIVKMWPNRPNSEKLPNIVYKPN